MNRDIFRRIINPSSRGTDEAFTSLEDTTESAFSMAIVTEVISNPIDYFSRKAVLDGVEQDYTNLELELGSVNPTDNQKKFVNSSQVEFAVQNTVAVRFVSEFSVAKEGPSILCFPFFPQHLSLPVKPGEYVWVYKHGNAYYWICRVSGPRQVDDVNYTHLPRINDLTSGHKKTEDLSLLYNFESTKSQSAAPADFFHNVASNSIAYKEEFTGEIVPRYSKGCGDLLIQGSNNAHILLGKEKFEEPGTTVTPEEMTPYESLSDLGDFVNRKPLSPAIDICVLRKSRELFDLQDNILADKNEVIAETRVNEGHAGLGSGLSAAANDRPENDGSRYFELEKGRESLSEKLGKEVFDQEFIDSDIYNCIARIYMTNSSTIDDLLFIPSLPGEDSSSPQDVLGLGNYGAMVALGANTRLIGTETVKIQNIVGTSGIQFTPGGDVIIHASRSGGAKIVLKSGGDIKIVPGDKGVVKIGADGPDEEFMFIPVGAALDFTTPTTDTGYVGNSSQITTTAGGLLPTADALSPPGPPIYATKVKIY